MSAAVTNKLVAVEIDQWDGSATRTLRTSNATLTHPTLAGEQYDPGLITTSLELATSIAETAERYGEAPQRSLRGAAVEFNLPEALWPRLGYHWHRRPMRVYEGEASGGFAGLGLAYTGRVADLRHTAGVVVRANVTLTDEAELLNNPLVTDFFDDSVPEALRGRPKPRGWGLLYSIEPLLLDPVNQEYLLLSEGLVEVMALRGGGYPWRQVTGTPRGGEYSVNLATGRMRLGSEPAGAELRADVRAASVTTASLFTSLVTAAGGVVDSAALAALDALVPYQIGFYAGPTPINLLDALDAIMGGACSWWTATAGALFTAGAIAAPSATADLRLTGVELASLECVGGLPPVWRQRMEHSRRWVPAQNIDGFATAAERQALTAPGLVAPEISDETIKDDEPGALDLPLIRTLVNSEADALAIGNRAFAAWREPRRLYDAKFRGLPSAGLYQTAAVEFGPVVGNARVHAVTRAIGGGAHAARLWI